MSQVKASFFTGPFIISYPKLVKPEAYQQDSNRLQYTFEAISDMESLKQWVEINKDTGEFTENVDIGARLSQMAKARFGDDFPVRQEVEAKRLTWPFHSGDDKAAEKGDKGAHYIGKKWWRAKALAEIKGVPNRPTLYVDEGDGLRLLVPGSSAIDAEIQAKFYGGAICRAEVNAVADEKGGTGKYVTFYINSVIWMADGERLGGEAHATRFYGVKGGASNYNPAQGMSTQLADDDIPL